MHVVTADDLSAVWLDAVRYLAARPQADEYDLVVEMRNPCREQPPIRRFAEDLLRAADWPIETTANTIFPLRLARHSRDVSHLTERYLRLLPRIRRASRENGRGTYFQRIVAYPLNGRRVNQLENVVRRLREKRRMSFVYELNLVVPGSDSRPMGFPCLSYVNMKLRDEELLLTAHYRNHYVVSRAYGNYLGLSWLQRYVADAAGVRVGPLVCVSGHAQIDPGRLGAVRDALARLDL